MQQIRVTHSSLDCCPYLLVAVAELRHIAKVHVSNPAVPQAEDVARVGVTMKETKLQQLAQARYHTNTAPRAHNAHMCSRPGEQGAKCWELYNRPANLAAAQQKHQMLHIEPLVVCLHQAGNATSQPPKQLLVVHSPHTLVCAQLKGAGCSHRMNSSMSMPLLRMPAMSVQRMPSIHSMTTTLLPHRSRRTQGIFTVGSVAKFRPKSSMLRASCSGTKA